MASAKVIESIVDLSERVGTAEGTYGFIQLPDAPKGPMGKPEFITSADDDIAKEAVKTVEAVKARFDKFEVAEAAQEIVNFSNVVNKYVNDTAPWSLAKEGKMLECAKVLYNVLESMRFIAALLAPYTPNISQDIYEQLNRTEKASDVRLDDLKWGEIPAGVITEKSKIKPVFLRLDSEIAGAAKKG